VSTFFVGDEMFWGQDRLDFVDAELARTWCAEADTRRNDLGD
jgi:hypothetical protein